MNENIDNSFEHLQKLIKDIRFSMFTTRGSDGRMYARPMTTQQANMGPDRPDTLWFFMSRLSDTVREFSADPAVNVNYVDSGDDIYVSVSGTASIVESKAEKERFWSTPVEAWFPQGIDDPDLALVCVQIQSAEYWHVTEGKLTQMAKMAKAVLTGQAPPDMGEHGKIA